MSEKGMDKPFCGLMPVQKYDDQSEMRKHFVAATGEFVGTFLFLLFAFLGHSMSVTTAADHGPGGVNSNSTIIYIALSYAMSLLVTVWTLYRISGGLFNPAVTIGLIITGNVPVVRGLILIPVQFISAICAAAVASCIIPGDIGVTMTTLAPHVGVAQGLFLEMFLTSQLVFTILMLAAEKSKATFIAPIGIGLALFVAEIAGVYYTGGSLNPARSFGPCVAAATFQGYHWIYWLGPVMGAVLAAGYYHFVKFFNYEDANPGQDSAGGSFDPTIERQESNPNELEMSSSKEEQSPRRTSGQYRSGNTTYQPNNTQHYGQPQQRNEPYPRSQQMQSGYNQEQQPQYRRSQDRQAPQIPADVVQGMDGRV